MQMKYILEKQMQSARQELYTCRIQKLIFLHLSTDLLCKDIASLLRINLKLLFNKA